MYGPDIDWSVCQTVHDVISASAHHPFAHMPLPSPPPPATPPSPPRPTGRPLPPWPRTAPFDVRHPVRLVLPPPELRNHWHPPRLQPHRRSGFDALTLPRPLAGLKRPYTEAASAGTSCDDERSAGNVSTSEAVEASNGNSGAVRGVNTPAPTGGKGVGLMELKTPGGGGAVVSRKGLYHYMKQLHTKCVVRA